MKKKLTRFLAAGLMILTVLAMSVPAAASSELSEEEMQTLAASIEQYVDTVMYMSDTDIDALITSGEDFYEITAQAIQDNREDLGSYVGRKEATTYEQDTDDGTATFTLTAEFENYDAEIVVTYDVEGSAPQNFMLNPKYPLSMNMLSAARNTVIGLVVVFVILIFLCFVIGLLKYLNPELRKGNKAQESKPAAPAPGAIAPAASPAPTASDDEELIAVMAAAIAAASAEGEDGSTYVVRSIRKVGTGKRWKRV